MKMSKVMVTGGYGFLGSHLVDRLVELGHQVTVVDNMSTGCIDNVKKPSHHYYWPLDVASNDFIECFEEDDDSFEYIFHLAAQINLRDSFKDPVGDARTNIMGTLNVIEAARRCDAKIVFTSTGGAIYNLMNLIPWSERHEANPQSPYGVSKLSCEHYLRVLSTDSAVLRLSNVYGPRQNPHGEAGVISIFMDRISDGSPLKIFGDGKQTRDFIFVDDVVDVLVMAMDRDLTGTYNVSSNIDTSVNEIAKKLSELTDKQPAIDYLPAVPGELRHSRLSYQKIWHECTWKPKISLEEGLRRTIDYYM
jgi:UDP-glucose 4-epimerase